MRLLAGYMEWKSAAQAFRALAGERISDCVAPASVACPARRTIIAFGAPQAGKSTLLNELCGSTTRPFVERVVSLHASDPGRYGSDPARYPAAGLDLTALRLVLGDEPGGTEATREASWGFDFAEAWGFATSVSAAVPESVRAALSDPRSRDVCVLVVRADQPISKNELEGLRRIATLPHRQGLRIVVNARGQVGDVERDEILGFAGQQLVEVGLAGAPIALFSARSYAGANGDTDRAFCDEVVAEHLSFWSPERRGEVLVAGRAALGDEATLSRAIDAAREATRAAQASDALAGEVERLEAARAELEAAGQRRATALREEQAEIEQRLAAIRVESGATGDALARAHDQLRSLRVDLSLPGSAGTSAGLASSLRPVLLAAGPLAAPGFVALWLGAFAVAVFLLLVAALVAGWLAARGRRAALLAEVQGDRARLSTAIQRRMAEASAAALAELRAQRAALEAELGELHAAMDRRDRHLAETRAALAHLQELAAQRSQLAADLARLLHV